MAVHLNLLAHSVRKVETSVFVSLEPCQILPELDLVVGQIICAGGLFWHTG